MQATRPRVIMAPLQVGLGIQLHHHFASKYLIDVLHTLGFCSSYGEILKFESSAAVSQETYLPNDVDDHTIMFSADNVDHNLQTLDGNDTFHGMGIIATVTPGITFKEPVPRIDTTPEQIIKSGKIEIKFHKLPAEMHPFNLKELRRMNNNDRKKTLETLLKISWPLHSPRVGWSGFMQTVQEGPYPGESSIHFLPMIDLNPSDLSCIFSTLSFICNEANRLQVTPSVTFDQPLYWKALMILQNEPRDSPLKSIVLRLGVFHMQMSFLGCIGHTMQSSGLYELLKNIYASNTIEHMMSGKSVSRAVRGHNIIDCALYILLLSIMIDVSLLEIEGNTDENVDEVNSADNEVIIFLQILDNKTSFENIQNDKNVEDIYQSIRNEFDRLSKYPTAKLWIQYMDMINIMKLFIKAERTGDWFLHLHAIQEMLPFFSATGHNLYLKSAYCYLQQMQTLETEYPDMYSKFCVGYHVVRRSNRYWTGISTDLAIEQTLMRSVKTSGGMKRGKGMSEVQRAQWLLSMPACSGINSAMQTVENLQYTTSEQHKEITKSRQERDTKDVLTILSYLSERNPFSESLDLRNIETGVTATNEVNVHNTQLVGKNIIESMKDQDAFSISFKKSMQVKTLNEKTKIRTQGDTLNVSSQLLVQRLITAAKHVTDDVSKIFSYDLSNFPSAMFHTSGSMQEPQKSNLAEALWAIGDCSAEYETSTTDVQYILDGGSLLHCIQWLIGVTFGRIADLYVDHVCRKYHTAIVVFDGYGNGPSTKDPTHQRRTKGIVGTKVLFKEDTPFKSKKEQFLGNVENKQNFITLLAERFKSQNIISHHAESDADVLIVQTAVESAKSTTTVLIGEDTDLLVLLCYHMNSRNHNIIFQSEMKQSTKKFKVWDLKKTKKVLGEEFCKVLPFDHAISGCDTTSRLFGIGKGKAVKKAQTDAYFMECANRFTDTMSKEEVLRIGEEVIVCLYNGVEHEGLDLLRFRKFTSKVMTSSKFVESILSNESLDWRDVNLNVKDWGWLIDGNIYLPVRSSLPPAPEELLKTIYCRCKCNCDTKRCNCRKHGLEYSVACTECRGTTCCNGCTPNYDSESDDFCIEILLLI
ncbi:unnamed protein product [Mytilus coruscus]|uniref:Tesmin/TSO1-like CXC domain-containing protein n=1 Tax=Mytilus coruscus TaxID=42192 RepID=A0A6J8E1M5_MYTCO|nr:unnamed protein product [Mytilus coruscus]